MDDHRFDALSKALATGTLSRRGVLRQMFVLGVGAAGAGLLRVGRQARTARAQTTGWPTIQRGARGPLVTALQALLQAQGLNVTVDGDFGPLTDAAVRQFQQRHRLVVDGVVGPQTWPVLIIPVQRGSQGPAVQAVQTLLTAAGLTVVVDGDFGPLTDAAVRQFQRSHGLVVDGVVGPQTWPVLLAAAAVPAAPAVPSAPPLPSSPPVTTQPAPPTPPAAAPCSASRTGPQATVHLAAASLADGLALDVRLDRSMKADDTTGAPISAVTTHLVVNRQGTGAPPVVQIDALHAGSVSQVTYRYGAGFQGVQQVTLTSTDGQTFQGIIDGKVLQPFQAGDDPSTVTFADGTPLPTLTADPALQAGLLRLRDQAKSAGATCPPSGASTGMATYHAVARRATVNQTNPYSGIVSAKCGQCDDDCGKSAAICWAGAIVGCVYSLGVGCVYGAVGCDGEAAGCEGICAAPGNPCCPVVCSGVCCGEGDSCADNDTPVCCPAGREVCNGRCCAAVDHCSNGRCCLAGIDGCGSQCCDRATPYCADPVAGLCCAKPGQVNAGGVCCDAGHACNGLCCAGGCDANGNCAGFGVQATLSVAPATVAAGNSVQVSGQAFPGQGAVLLTLAGPDGTVTLGTAMISRGAFTTTVTIPAGTAAGSYTIHAEAPGAMADAPIQVVAPTAGWKLTVTYAGQALRPDDSIATDSENYILLGTNFQPGPVSVYISALDAFTDASQLLFSTEVGADGTFSHDLRITRDQVGGQEGYYNLQAVQNGVLVGEITVSVVLGEIFH